MRTIRTVLTLVLSLVICSAIAQAGTKSSDKKDKDKDHHSRVSKVAFWRHHKDSDKKAKAPHSTQASSNHTAAKPVPVKPASAKQDAGKKQPKPAQQAVARKGSANKVPSVSKKKAQPKPENTKKAS